MTTRGGGLQKALDKNPAGESQDIPGVSPQKEFSDSTKKAAPYVVSAFLIIVGLLWTAIAPPTSYASPLYILPSVAWLILMSWWSGTEPIPGKRMAAKGLQHNWLVPLAALVAAAGAGVALGELQNLASSFAWTFFAGAIKIPVLTRFQMRLSYCPECRNTRWAQLHEGAWYCPRCGQTLGSTAGFDEGNR